MSESRRCGFIKRDGERCGGRAIWGTEPARCIAHREDGGPTTLMFEKGNQFGRLKRQHGFYEGGRREMGGIEEETARVLLVQERLARAIKGERRPVRLVTLYRLYGVNMGRLVGLIERYEAETGRSGNVLLEVANGEPKERLRAEWEALPGMLKGKVGPTSNKTRQRSPRYWLIYGFIADYIERYWVGPTQQEIKKVSENS